jgi:hypothetical protein
VGRDLAGTISLRSPGAHKIDTWHKIAQGSWFGLMQKNTHANEDANEIPCVFHKTQAFCVWRVFY